MSDNLNVKMLKERGFSFIESLVVIAIISILSAIALISYPKIGRQLTLERSANKIVADIRRAQEMAMSAKECNISGHPVCKGGVPPGGYGFSISKSADDRYQIYADSGSPPKVEEYTSGEEIETIFLEKDVYIKDFSPPSATFSINFKPPDPVIKIKDAAGKDKDDVDIIIALRKDISKTKIIKVNKAGLIYVE